MIGRTLQVEAQYALEIFSITEGKVPFSSGTKIWVQLLDSTQSTFLGNASPNHQKVLNRVQNIVKRK